MLLKLFRQEVWPVAWKVGLTLLGVLLFVYLLIITGNVGL